MRLHRLVMLRARILVRSMGRGLRAWSTSDRPRGATSFSSALDRLIAWPELWAGLMLHLLLRMVALVRQFVILLISGGLRARTRVNDSRGVKSILLALHPKLRFLNSIRFNNRVLLMILVSGAQLTCVTAGLVWFGKWMSASILSEMREQVLTSNEQYVTQMTDMMRRWKLESLHPGSDDWERVQRIIEQTRLPNDGYLSIIETNQGRLLCHPDLRQNPILMSMQLGTHTFDANDGGLMIKDCAAGRTVARGRVRLPDGDHLVVVQDLPELKVKVLAHQRERTILQVLSQLNARMWSIGLIVALIIAAATAGLTLIIVRRYEATLAALNKGLEQQVERRSRALMKTRDAVIFGLARLAESRHEDTGDHLDRIRTYVEILAREVARHDPTITEEMIHTIALASSLHDIGKVAIPDEVLLKPGKLTPRQREVMRRHTIIGCDCLIDIKRRLGEDDFLTTACQIALSHHERWNGTGYPFGLAGEYIPLAGRIVAVADVYDALTSSRVYKGALSHEQAKEMIVKGSGKQFDPVVVEAFLRAELDFAEISGAVCTLPEHRSAA
jgi:response regulator RpfG family c-di-GMP phosphodiesterase